MEDKFNWVMEEKKKHVDAGLDPFTFKKNEKKLEKEKQALRELKNKINATGPAGKGNGMDAVLDAKENGGAPSNRPEPKDGTLKKRQDGERESIRKRERKALMKQLTLAQMSTASMGKFDKKATKAEPNAPASMQIHKKKSNKQLHAIETDRSAEKNRAMKILAQM